MRNCIFCLALAGLIGIPLAAQNAVPNGDFESGTTGWTMKGFNDPLGTTGVHMTDVNGTTESTNALYGDFKTLTPVMYAWWDGSPFTLAQGSYPFTADISWVKQVTPPIYVSSVNRVEFRLYDASTTPATLLTNVRQQVPGQTGYIERVKFTTTYTIPATGSYYIGLYLRHSNLAGIPFICNVDDVALGEYGAVISGTGSAQFGNTLELPLWAPTAGGKAYYVGSSFGAGPIPIDTRFIDLSLDSLLLLSTSGAIPSIFGSFNGFLDTSGKATARLNIPNVSAIAGTKLHNAFITIDSTAPSSILTISNTYAFTIQP